MSFPVAQKPVERVETLEQLQTVASAVVARLWPSAVATVLEVRNDGRKGFLGGNNRVRSQLAAIVTVFGGGPSVFIVLPCERRWVEESIAMFARPPRGR